MFDVEALYRQHDRHLRRTLRRRFDPSVPDVLIEDACASAWAIAWVKRDHVRDENPVGWLVTVAWHEALALLRRRRFEAYGGRRSSWPTIAATRSSQSPPERRSSCSRASGRTSDSP